MSTTKPPYDRAQILADAARARERGKPKEAIEHFERVLDIEPENVDLHRQVAPLLAEVGRDEEAWGSYRRAARIFAKQGYLEKAIRLYRDAMERMPESAEPWVAFADLAVSRGHRTAAMETLREAERRFRGRRHRRQAIRVVEAFCRLEPHRPERRLDLARLLVATDRREEARDILDRLSRSTRGPLLKRVRRLELLHFPSARSLYAWTKTLG